MDRHGGGEPCDGADVCPGLASPAQPCGYRIRRPGDQPLSGGHQHGAAAVLPGGAQGPAGVGQRFPGPEQLERRELLAAPAAGGGCAGGAAGSPPGGVGAG